MTIAIRKELEDLQIQPGSTARKASEKMRGIWYDGIVLVDMKERNFDIGLDDGYITPTLVPGICEGAEPQSYPVPTLAKFEKYGFAMNFEVEPKEFEKGRIHSIIYPNGGPNRFQPAKCIPVVMDYIIKAHLAHLNGSTKVAQKTASAQDYEAGHFEDANDRVDAKPELMAGVRQ